MNEIAVSPELLYGWASGPIDAVADDTKSAYSTMSNGCGNDGVTSAEGKVSTATALADILAADGAWGRDELYIRGRLYGFAEGLVACAQDYEGTDTANADHLDVWFDTDYSPGNEPGEVGDSKRYQD